MNKGMATFIGSQAISIAAIIATIFVLVSMAKKYDKSQEA